METLTIDAHVIPAQDWSYQTQMINDVLGAVRERITHTPDPNKGCVMAGSVSSGKTRMVLLIIEELLKEGTVKNVLISAHGQKIIRSQMKAEADKLKAEGRISFTFEELKRAKSFHDKNLPQVVIAIPQTMKHLKHPPSFDMVVVDEAHEFYFAEDGILQRIMKECAAQYTIFLTGTPSKFIADKRFPVVAAVSVMELLNYGVVNSPAISLSQSIYDFTKSDYTQAYDLNKHTKETPEQTKATLDNVLMLIHKRLAPQINQADSCGPPHLKDKTMFACHSIRQAEQVRDYFVAKGIDVLLSTSDEGNDDAKLEEFAKDPRLILIVVRRGVLGFSCEPLVNLVDLTCTLNVDRLFQLFGRILRLHPDGKEKLFLKVVPHKMAFYNHRLMTLIINGLCNREKYLSYDGGLTAPFIAKIAFSKDGDKAESHPHGLFKKTASVPVWDFSLDQGLSLLPRVEAASDSLFGEYVQTTLKEAQLQSGMLVNKSSEEWVPVAEELAAKNGGMIPTYRWLVDNGFRNLTAAMYRRSDLFAHLPREKNKFNSPEEWVPVAEALAAENGGVLPNYKWLVDNGFAGLTQVFNQELFAHITREKKFKFPEEWVPVAEDMAAENGGVLQSVRWLATNGHSGLQQAMYNHPKLFAHIEQEKRKGKSAEEWVPVAEKLAAENGGTIPSIKWLVDNGHSGLTYALHTSPGLFAHIQPARKKQRSPEEWVLVAEQLADENGGILPNGRWLDKNGYSGLSRSMRKYPEPFVHIQQMWRSSGSQDASASSNP